MREYKVSIGLSLDLLPWSLSLSNTDSDFLILPFPAVDLIGMDVELFRQYFYGLSFLEGFQANLRFESRSESSTGCRAHFLDE
jgi:hypothetical protein